MSLIGCDFSSVRTFHLIVTRACVFRARHQSRPPLVCVPSLKSPAVYIITILAKKGICGPCLQIGIGISKSMGTWR